MDKTKGNNIQLKYDTPENVVLVYTFLVVKNIFYYFFLLNWVACILINFAVSAFDYLVTWTCISKRAHHDLNMILVCFTLLEHSVSWKMSFSATLTIILHHGDRLSVKSFCKAAMTAPKLYSILTMPWACTVCFYYHAVYLMATLSNEINMYIYNCRLPAQRRQFNLKIELHFKLYKWHLIIPCSSRLVY